MASESLHVPEEDLAEVIAVIRAGLMVRMKHQMDNGSLSENTVARYYYRAMTDGADALDRPTTPDVVFNLARWCDEEEEYLNEMQSED